MTEISVLQQHHQLTHSAGHVLDYLINVPEQVSSPYLHVFFHGFSRIESYAPPVFARRHMAAELQAVSLHLSDPIHRLTPDSACGWYLLGEDELMPRMLAVCEEVRQRYALKATVWHGPSSGGYAAIKYCLRSGSDGLAFTIAPHNDPLVLPHWPREAEPFADLPAMAHPQPTMSLIPEWISTPGTRSLHAAICEKDVYFATEHLRPILEAADGHPSVRAALLRNGRGHGPISNIDYATQLAQAIRHWEALLAADEPRRLQEPTRPKDAAT